MSDTRQYTISLHLGYAEALQDALFGAYRTASLAATGVKQRLDAAREHPVTRAGECAHLERDYHYALKRVAALDELMKAVGRHI